ncbi:MAG: DNA repair protein RecO [Deltaproteobacteria bacterium]|nr:DNA repair protein RecO [Deltaproteobacteria bacterium]
MLRTKGEAILLRSKPSGENDLMVTLLHGTRGKVLLLARHALKSRKRFLGSLELFNHLEVEFTERAGVFFGILESSAVIDAFPLFRKDSVAFGQAAYACELVETATRAGEPCRDILDWLLDFLVTLNRIGPGTTWSRVAELKLLDHIGLAPGLDRCSVCGGELASRARQAYDVARGGVLCDVCSAGGTNHVSLGTLKTLSVIRKSDLSLCGRIRFSGKAAQEAKNFLGDFLRYHMNLDYPLKSKIFLEKLNPRFG